MTPDRIDTPRDDADNGVLDDASSADPAVLGLVAGATARLDVLLPSLTNVDDRGDDDVVDGEVVIDGEVVVDWPDDPPSA
ncbi:hypothetical protein [Microbacterium sp. No. 7]|uniref:hypothetical protein n=1 Tax=Microbacterium sp. No. 7 TaxID=1714373 RepID=UPI0006CF29AE|nr:hypothetical protein [Microbacterium sp. No. 7]ALJ20826.1 hypothetical protein AOA12_13305 [Microbacterium sp. No. 7]